MAEKQPLIQTGNSGFAFSKLWEEATKAVKHVMDAILGVNQILSQERSQRDQTNVVYANTNSANMKGNTLFILLIFALIIGLGYIIITRKKI